MAFNDIHIDEPTDEELCEVFIEEAESIVVELGELADRCRKDLGNPILLKDIRRQFHTLKGSGRMVGLDAIGEAAWRVEDMLNRWLSSELPATPRLCDFIESCAPFFGAWAAELKEHGKVSVDAKSIGFEVDVFLDYLKNPAAASESGQAAPADFAAQEEEQGHEQSASEYVPLAAGDMSDFDALMGLSEDATPPAVNDGINLAAAGEHAATVSAEPAETSETFDGNIESDAQAPAYEESDNFAMVSAVEAEAFALEEPETHGQHFVQRQVEDNAILSTESENVEEVGEASEISCIAPICSEESFEDGASDAKYSESDPDIQEQAGEFYSVAEGALEPNEAMEETWAADKDDIEQPEDTDCSIASEKAFEDERDELAKFMSKAVAAEAEPSFSAGHTACDEEEQNSAAQPVYDKSSAETLENCNDGITDEIQPSCSEAPTQGSARLDGFAELLEEGGSGVERVQAQWEEEADSTKAKSSKPMKENRDYAPLIYSGMIAAILAAGIYGFFFM